MTVTPVQTFVVDGFVIDPNASDDDDIDDASDDGPQDTSAMDVSSFSDPPLNNVTALGTFDHTSLTDTPSADIKPVLLPRSSETPAVSTPKHPNSPSIAILIGESCSPEVYQRLLREQNEMYRIISACQSLGDKMDSLVRELQLSEL